MNEEIRRVESDNRYWSSAVFLDKDNKIHIYNPSITLEEFNKLMEK